MKVVVITQEDSFTVPKNIEKLIRINFVEISHIVNINSEQSLVNRKDLFIKGFGIFQSVKMGFSVIKDKIINLIDKAFSYKLPLAPKSLKSVAFKNNIPYLEISNPNETGFLDLLEKASPDLVVSYSAPLIFKKRLLEIPTLGCINLHCSKLPDYAGVMPSFWTLYNKEKITGTTVHYMDSKIDNGSILGQKVVNIDPNETMFTLIKKTKNIGGDLMVEVLNALHHNTLIPKENKVEEKKYYTWPTIENFRNFRKKGGKLI